VTTILCLGNTLRGDDGAGPAVAERLRARGVDVLVEEPANLMDAWVDADDVVVVDTVQSGEVPGTVHRLDVRHQPLPSGFRSGSTHLLGIADAIEFARVLDRLPAGLRVIGIEGGSFAIGEGLSPEVERAVVAVADELSAGRLGAGTSGQSL
jgi:hydrogenase maturation protease